MIPCILPRLRDIVLQFLPYILRFRMIFDMGRLSKYFSKETYTMSKKEITTSESNDKKLRTKDLIYAGAFSAIYLVVMLIIVM